jgi:hypothetical protein
MPSSQDGLYPCFCRATLVSVPAFCLGCFLAISSKRRDIAQDAGGGTLGLLLCWPQLSCVNTCEAEALFAWARAIRPLTPRQVLWREAGLRGHQRRLRWGHRRACAPQSVGLRIEHGAHSG